MISDVELRQWADVRGDDAGRLARQLLETRTTLARLLTAAERAVDHDFYDHDKDVAAALESLSNLTEEIRAKEGPP